MLVCHARQVFFEDNSYRRKAHPGEGELLLYLLERNLAMTQLERLEAWMNTI